MGHRITRAASHLSVDEVKERMNTDARPWVREHWWIIYNALVAPRKAEEIALHTGVSATTVHRVISTYNRQGPASMETPGKGGRRHQHLTLPEEVAHHVLAARRDLPAGAARVIGSCEGGRTDVAPG